VQQQIASCFEERVGVNGLDRTGFEATLARCVPALDRFRRAARERSTPHFALPFLSDDLEPARALAAHLRENASDVVFCGTGGSSLSGQALAQIAGRYALSPLPESAPRLHFADNLDPEAVAAVTNLIGRADPFFVIISKSGTTAETSAQAVAIIDAFAAAGRKDDVASHIAAVTEPGASEAGGLKALALGHGMRVLDHPSDLGGRYSVFSNTGMIPALVAGLDPLAVRGGAADVLRALMEVETPAGCPAAIGAALNVALAEQRGRSINVLMAYGGRLERFTHWFVQLWAESLGKNGKGTTPLAALGPVDQHSQLQLFLDGPKDKFFTLVTAPQAARGPALPAALAGEAGADYFAGKRIGDLVEAMQHATADALADAGHPVRVLELDSIDGRAAGALMMHLMLETMFAADLLGVDPFDQPAVEAGKALARRNLAAL
jgi:glucose-6-phosphate isomerase